MGSVRIASLAALTAASVSAFAAAGTPPVVNVDVNVNGNNTNYLPAGTATAFTGVYNFVGSGAGVSHLTSWNFNATNNLETSPAFVSGNFTFVNTSAGLADFDVLITLDTSPQGPFTLIGGSVSGGLTADFDGGFFSSTGGAPIWTSYIDGVFQASLLNLAGPVTANPFDSVNIGADFFGDPIPDMVGPALGNAMQIRFRFTLGAGDQASFTSVFVAEVVPAPAGLALLGLAGFAGRRRRN
ncbi:MAG: hypothetical protein KF724_00705 [Phycisphaeraceae bacterium]|nr:hypothetical protein [Phycisphaeraceae bacterium]